ncbi:MAG: ATP-binding protein [Pseudomonadota bacterium]
MKLPSGKRKIAIAGDVQAALRLAAVYCVFSSLWILFSDQIVYLLVKNPEFLTKIQTVKGWLFVLTTSLILFVLLKREIGHYLKAEKRLLESERNYRSIFENAVEGFFQSTPQGRFIDVNPAFSDMLGYASPRELVEDIADISQQYYLDPADRQTYKQLLEADGFVEGFEFRVRKKDGTPIWVSNSTRAIHDDDGHVIRYEGIVNDITARKLDEQEKERLQSQLMQAHKMEAVGTLAGGIAHDFNNLLGIILGNAELALDDIPEAVQAREYLGEIKTASLRAKDVVVQLLRFARKSDQVRKRILLQDMIHGTLALLRSSMPVNIDIRCHLTDEPATILADPTQIHQVIINLCINAAHAMPDGGALDICLDSAVNWDETIDPKLPLKPGRYFSMSISDTGHGIEPEYLGRIFEPYFTTKEVGKGTGMGLAVVHGIVTVLGGGIAVKSRKGEGSEFKVFLPSADGPADQMSGGPVGDLPRGRERILFVDDEAGLATLGEERLQRLGYSVEVRTSPLEALSLFRSDPGGFDLIITDMTMPEMSGYVLVERALEIRPDMRFVLCTGYNDSVNREKASALGIAGFLEKPHEKRALALMVRTVLDGRENS